MGEQVRVCVCTGPKASKSAARSYSIPDGGPFEISPLNQMLFAEAILNVNIPGSEFSNTESLERWN